MNHLEPHLIAVDLDDTALQELHSLNSVTAKVLREASRQGHPVMIATARPFCLVEKHYRALGLNTPICLCNGADYLLPGEAWFPKETAYLPKEQVAAVLAQFEGIRLRSVWIESNDDLYVEGNFNGGSGAYFQEMYRRSHRLKLRRDHLPAAGRLFIWAESTSDEQKRLERIQQIPCVGVASRPWMGSLYESRSASDPLPANEPEPKSPPMQDKDAQGMEEPEEQTLCLYRVWSVLADKWFGVEKTAAYYGIPAERIVTFGDDTNDLRMLRSAHKGYAMKNGNPSVIGQIQNITRWDNREGGVGRELNEMLELGLKL